jgi:hypothetical protein
MSGISGCYGTNIDDGSNFVHFDTMAVTGGTADASVGACCSPADGSCTVVTEQACADLNGSYGGGGSTCEASTCVGACCQPSRTCSDTVIHQCSGRFQGPNTTCANTSCPCQPPFADFDEDGDVDLDDFGGFQRCVSPLTGGILPGCECFDRNDDNDVDGSDFTAFSNCMTGPAVPLDPLSPPAGCIP